MKNQRRPLRLGSFELLESRALLAHAGLPEGMFRQSFEPRQFTDFRRAPAPESHSFGAISARSMPSNDDFGGHDRGPRSPRNFGGDFNPPSLTFDAPASIPTSYTGSSTTLVSVYVPQPNVTVVITISSSAPQFSEPLTSTIKDPLQRQTQNASFNPPASNLQSSPAPSRSSNVAMRLDSASVLSSLSLKRSATESTTDESEDTSTVSDERDEQTRSDDQDASQRTPNTEATQKPQPTTTAADETDLIELDPEELLKRAKRKSARTQTTPIIDSKLRESTVRETFALRAPERNLENRFMPAEVEQVIDPVDDDLIELLAADQMVEAKPTAVRAQPFVAGASLTLEANLGFYQAVETAEAETTPATIPAALPAEVATALPARATE